MVRFTVSLGFSENTYLFSGEEEVVIGRRNGKGVTLPLDSEEVLPVHLTIVGRRGRYSIYNRAHDPFTTLNGDPFGVRHLSNGDRLEVGGYLIICHLDEEPVEKESLSESEFDEEWSSMEDTGGLESDLDLDAELRELEALAANREGDVASWGSDDIDALVRQVEAWDVEENENLVEANVETAVGDSVEMTQEQVSDESDSEQPYSFWHWWVGAGALCVLLFLFLSGIYLVHLREEKRHDERIAARAIADVAMALMQAQFSETRPQKQNWTDPSFVRKNLGAILGRDYEIQACFDAQGQLANTPYLLRVYTTHDLSHFLVMAQPAPSLMQWLIPKAAIAVDSQSMQLRKIEDLRNINRSLVNLKNFDEGQAEEISLLVSQGDLISITALASQGGEREGFALPRALSVMQPQAAQRIYNAPRYFPFSERVLDKLLALQEASPSDLQVVRSDLKSFEKLTDLIFYSTRGLGDVLNAQRILELIVPDRLFRVAHLKLGGNGKVVGGQLLMPGDSAAVQGSDMAFSVEQTFGEQDTRHPFVQELALLKEERDALLTPLAEKLKAVLESHLQSPRMEFAQEWQSLNDLWVSTESKASAKLSNGVYDLIAQYSHEPMRDLLAMVQEADLSGIALDPLKADLSQKRQRLLKRIESQLVVIRAASSLGELALQVDDASTLLSWDSLPDPTKLQLYQRQLFEIVIHKLSDFLLSPTANLSDRLKREERYLLAHIFGATKVCDPAVSDYYLHEFDCITEK